MTNPNHSFYTRVPTSRLHSLTPAPAKLDHHRRTRPISLEMDQQHPMLVASCDQLVLSLAKLLMPPVRRCRSLARSAHVNININILRQASGTYVLPTKNYSPMYVRTRSTQLSSSPHLPPSLPARTQHLAPSCTASSPISHRKIRILRVDGIIERATAVLS